MVTTHSSSEWNAVDRLPSSPSPNAEALNWVLCITSIGLMMVLPAVGGHWLDQRFGTSYWSLIGLVLGLVIGMAQIAVIAGAAKRRTADNAKLVKKSQPPSDSEPRT